MIPALVPCAIDCCRLIIELRDQQLLNLYVPPYLKQILEAAHRIGAADMKKHALDLVVGHFVKVTEALKFVR